MPDTALETCCTKLAAALPTAMDGAADRLGNAKTDAEAQVILTTIERLLKVAKMAADNVAKSDPDGRTVTTEQMRGVAVQMTERVFLIAGRSPYGDRIRELLE